MNRCVHMTALWVAFFLCASSQAAIYYEDIPDSQATWWYDYCDQYGDECDFFTHPATVQIGDSELRISHGQAFEGAGVLLVAIGVVRDCPVAGVRAFGGDWGPILSVCFEQGDLIGLADQSFAERTELFHASTQDWGQPVPGGMAWIGRSGYLGAAITLDGQTHYAWIGVTVPEDYREAITITDYAYETVPGQPIEAGATPEPSTLLLLAVGVASVVRRRTGVRP